MNQVCNTVHYNINSIHHAYWPDDLLNCFILRSQGRYYASLVPWYEVVACTGILEYLHKGYIPTGL